MFVLQRKQKPRKLTFAVVLNILQVCVVELVIDRNDHILSVLQKLFVLQTQEKVIQGPLSADENVN